MDGETAVTFVPRKEGNVVFLPIRRSVFVPDNWYFCMYSIGDAPAATMAPLCEYKKSKAVLMFGISLLNFMF